MLTHINVNLDNVSKWLQTNGAEMGDEDPIQTALRLSEPKEDLQRQYVLFPPL